MINKRDIRFFNVARAASKCSDFNRVHIGAVLVYGKHDIISTGFNTYKTNSIQKKYNKFRDFSEYDSAVHSTHAEIAAISKMPWYVYENGFDFSKISVYVYREHMNGKLAMARCCPACMSALIDLGARDMFYTTEKGYCYERIG